MMLQNHVVEIHGTDIVNAYWFKKTHHKGIPCFFSTGSRYDLRASSRSNNQGREGHVEEY